MAPIIPDLTNPRYRDEVGWFLYHEKYGRENGGSYDAERVAYSRLLLEEVLRFAERDTKWLADKTVVSIGCGCTGDLVGISCCAENRYRPAALCVPETRIANDG